MPRMESRLQLKLTSGLSFCPRCPIVSLLQRQTQFVSARPRIYLAREEYHSARLKKGDKRIWERYVSFMAERKVRILLIDEDSARLSSAATILILSGYSVLPLTCLELFVTLKRGNYDWLADLVLIRAVLDAGTENLFETQLRFVPVRKLSRAATLDINLPAIVNEILAGTKPVSA